MLNDFDRITEIKCHRLSALELHNCSHYRMITNYSPPPAFFFFFCLLFSKYPHLIFKLFLSLSLSQKKTPSPSWFHTHSYFLSTIRIHTHVKKVGNDWGCAGECFKGQDGNSKSKSCFILKSMKGHNILFYLFFYNK